MTSQAAAAEKCDPNNLVESGTFTAHAESVGFMVSVQWGVGTLTRKNGEAHKFSVVGGKVIETGFGETHLKGTVYNLDKIEDFAGVYYGAATETAVVKGLKGGITAKNSSNCVYIHADSSTEGVRLSPPAPGGVKIKLTD
jgi:hypothetical protein